MNPIRFSHCSIHWIAFCFWFSTNDYKTHKNYSTFHDAYRQHFYKQYYSILKKCFDHKWYLRSPTNLFNIVFCDYLHKDSNSFTIWDTSEIRVNEFRHKLENTNWDFSDQANNANDPNTAYNIFIDKYTGLFDACFPFKTIKGKALNSFRKPWLTKSLLRVNQ